MKYKENTTKHMYKHEGNKDQFYEQTNTNCASCKK